MLRVVWVNRQKANTPRMMPKRSFEREVMWLTSPR
jgi:hypothetical protein